MELGRRLFGGGGVSFGAGRKEAPGPGGSSASCPGAFYDGGCGFFNGNMWKGFRRAVLLFGGAAFLFAAPGAREEGGRGLAGDCVRPLGRAAAFLAPGGGGRAFRGRGGAHAAVGSGSGPLLFCASDRQSAPCVEKKAGNTFLCLGAIAVLALRSPCGDSEPGAVRRTAKSVWLALSVQPDGALVFLSAVPGIDFFKQL